MHMLHVAHYTCVAYSMEMVDYTLVRIRRASHKKAKRDAAMRDVSLTNFISDLIDSAQ